jgi:hypothetical protein
LNKESKGFIAERELKRKKEKTVYKEGKISRIAYGPEASGIPELETCQASAYQYKVINEPSHFSENINKYVKKKAYHNKRE